MARAWIGVGEAKPSSAATWHSEGERPSAANPPSGRAGEAGVETAGSRGMRA